MKIEYDDEADAAFVWLLEELHQQRYTSEVWPGEFREQIGLLFDEGNKLVALEILFASSWLSPALLEQGRQRG